MAPCVQAQREAEARGSGPASQASWGDGTMFTCAESMTATIMFSSSPLRKVSSGNWTEKEGN